MTKTINHHDLEHMLHHKDAEPSMIDFSLLKEITNGFSEERKIGSRGFGEVYMGVLPSRNIVAVKRFFKHKAYKDGPFQNEVECLMKVKHINIARFYGYCALLKGKMVPQSTNDDRHILTNDPEKLLCFEYLSKGNLREQLKDASCGLEWPIRYQIIRGICHGLDHLHENHIIHSDLKPENILLDDYMRPKIIDFGLSRLLEEDKNQTITENIVGSWGYMAPEYMEGTISFHSDVYSLGVIILEMITGKKSVLTIEKELANWSLRLGTSQPHTTLEQIKVCLEIGKKCVDQQNPKSRPVTREIIRRLNETETSKFSSGNASSTSSERAQSAMTPERMVPGSYMVPARSLTIAWGTDPRFWKWTPRSDSRFGECAELLQVNCLKVSGEIAPQRNQPAATRYTAHLVYKLKDSTLGLQGSVQVASIHRFNVYRNRCQVSLHPTASGAGRADGVTYPVTTRTDGWLELKLAEFSNDEALTVEIFREDIDNKMCGLFIEGMEVRRH